MAGRAGFEPGESVEPTSLYSQIGPATAALPPKAAERLLALQEKAEDLHLLVPSSQERQELGTERLKAQQRLDRLLAHVSEGGYHLHADDPRCVAARREVAELTAAKDRIEARYERASQAWQPIRRVLSNVEAWLRDRPGGTLLQDIETKPALQKGEDLLAAIERLRRRGRELQADLHRVESAPFPSAHAKAKMRQEIEALAARGAPSVSLLVEHDRQVAWPTYNLQSHVYNSQLPSFSASDVTDTLALFAWLHRTQLIEALDREIDAEADDPASLSHEARQQGAAQVGGDLLAVERDESELVWQAMAQDLPAAHRADCNPLAILGCRLVTV